MEERPPLPELELVARAGRLWCWFGYGPGVHVELVHCGIQEHCREAVELGALRGLVRGVDVRPSVADVLELDKFPAELDL